MNRDNDGNIPHELLQGSNAYHDGLLTRIKWADENYDLVVRIYASSIKRDPSTQENIDFFNGIRNEYRLGHSFHSDRHLYIHRVLNNLGIPDLVIKTADKPLGKSILELRTQAFADTVYNLKASLECTAVVEAKIQEELTKHYIEMVRDIHGVTDYAWYAVIHPKEPASSLMAHLREIFWVATADETKAELELLIEAAAHGYIWLGYESSPEIALASAMVEFRRDQLRLLGLHA